LEPEESRTPIYVVIKRGDREDTIRLAAPLDESLKKLAEELKKGFTGVEMAAALCFRVDECRVPGVLSRIGEETNAIVFREDSGGRLGYALVLGVDGWYVRYDYVCFKKDNVASLAFWAGLASPASPEEVFVSLSTTAKTLMDMVSTSSGLLPYSECQRD